MPDAPDTASPSTVAFWRSLVRSLPEFALLVFDHDLRFVAVEGGAVERQRVDPAQIEGRLLWDALPPDRAAFYEPAYRAALAGEVTVFDQPALDGNRAFRVEVAPIHDARGTVVAGMAIAQDITDARRAEEELRESELRYRLLAENSTDIVMRERPDGVILYASPAAREVLGREPDELIGSNRLAITHPDDRHLLEESFRRARRGETSVLSVTRAQRASGGWVWLETHSLAVRDAAGEVVEFQSSSRDVTARLMSERTLREVELRRDALVGQLLIRHDEERSRIATALHDDTVQMITAAALSLDRIAKAGDAETLAAGLAAVRSMLGDAVERARSITFELRPQLLEASGLGPALETMAPKLDGCAIELVVDVPRLRDPDEWLLYTTVHEAVRSLADAGPGGITVELRHRGDRVHGRVAHTSAAPAGLNPPPPGLAMAAERIRLAGGEVSVFAIGNTAVLQFEMHVAARAALVS